MDVGEPRLDLRIDQLPHEPLTETDPAVSTDPAFDDPDQALPTEDDNPETLAGDPVEFDPDAPEPTGGETPADSGEPAEDA